MSVQQLIKTQSILTSPPHCMEGCWQIYKIVEQIRSAAMNFEIISTWTGKHKFSRLFGSQKYFVVMVRWSAKTSSKLKHGKLNRTFLNVSVVIPSLPNLPVAPTLCPSTCPQRCGLWIHVVPAKASPPPRRGGAPINWLPTSLELVSIMRLQQRVWALDPGIVRLLPLTSSAVLTSAGPTSPSGGHSANSAEFAAQFRLNGYDRIFPGHALPNCHSLAQPQ